MPPNSSTVTYDLLIDQQFLILTNPKDLSVEYMNFPVQHYCGGNRENLKTGFFKEIVHPGDLPSYQTSLTSLNSEFNNACRIRLRSKDQTWNNFTFRNRHYRIGGREMVLSLAIKDVEQKQEEQNSAGVNLLRKEYEHLLESLDEAFALVEVIFSKDGEPIDYLFLKTNPAYEHQVNLKGVVGKTIKEILPVVSENMLKTFGQVAKTGKPVRFQDKSVGLDNTWYDLYAFKVGSKENRQVAILFRNITEGKLAEEDIKRKLHSNRKDLEETTKLLQTVFDTTNLGIAVLKLVRNEQGEVEDFIIERVNKVLGEMYPEQEVVGQSYLKSTKYSRETGIFDALKQTAESGESLDCEFSFKGTGEVQWYRITARHTRDLLITTVENITKVKAEAEELRESLRFKRELVRTTPEVIMIVNLNTFSVRYINKDLVPEAGITREKVQNLGLQEIIPFIHPRDREKMMDLHRNLLKSSEDQILDIELRLKLKSVSWEWFNVRGKVFNRRDKNWVNEYVLLVRNITDQKSTQKALLKAEKLSIQGELARTFAHELRNPLASIGMVGEVMNKKIPQEKQEEFRPYLEILKRSTKTLNNLVNNLLNASNYTPAMLQKEDLAVILDKTVHNASDRIYLAGIKVEKHYQGPYLIMADKEKLQIALLNIIVNASEATTPGEGVIKLGIEAKDAEFILTIQDNGHGMEEQDIDHLFEAFYSKKESGMGVGLSSVKNILEEHDAQIHVESQSNEGTCFTLHFHNAAHI